MEHLIKELHKGNFSCVIENRGVIRTFARRGVADLYDLLKTDVDFLRGASVADKVIGKAAAALMVLGGVSTVYADVIGDAALALLCDAGVKAEATETVPFIKNRDGSDWCPLERLCRSMQAPAEIYPLIEEFVKRMSQTA